MNNDISKLYSLEHPLILELVGRIQQYTENKLFINNELCWIWIGGKTHNGYPTISFLGQPFRVNRLMYWIYKDFCQSNLLFEPKVIVRHKCNIPACINPDHLLKGTQLDNVKDRDNSGRNFNKNKTHCINGHEYTLENTYIRPDTGTRDCKRCRNLSEYNRIRLS